MSKHEKPPWQEEYEKLPLGFQQFIGALSGIKCHGVAFEVPSFMAKNGDEEIFFITIDDSKMEQLISGFREMLNLAQALTAPWPPPNAPKRQIRAFNVVETMAGESGGFDQKCCFGHRVESYAVYCHNEDWPGAPRKCKRGHFDDFLHEDCPGFVLNPDYREDDNDRT